MSAIAKSLPRGGASRADAGDKRKKQIVLVGGLILVVLVVFQFLRLGSASSSSAPASQADTIQVAAAVVPTSGAVTSGTGADVETASPASRRALNRMPVKDPFVPLLPSPRSPGTGSAQASAPPSAQASPTPKVDKSPSPAQEAASGPPIGFSAAGASPSKRAPLPPPTAAIISINGSSQIVGRSKLFPAKAPAFRLVTVGRTFVRIGVAGGSFANGRGTITMRRGQRVTLENTATGVRYVLRFAAVSSTPVETAPPPSGQGDN